MKRTGLPAGSLFGVLSVTTLISVELFSTAGAVAWALSGLFGLSRMSSYVLAAIVGLPSLGLVVKVAQLAVESERAILLSSKGET